MRIENERGAGPLIKIFISLLGFGTKVGYLKYNYITFYTQSSLICDMIKVRNQNIQVCSKMHWHSSNYFPHQELASQRAVAFVLLWTTVSPPLCN